MGKPHCDLEYEQVRATGTNWAQQKLASQNASPLQHLCTSCFGWRSLPLRWGSSQRCLQVSTVIDLCSDIYYHARRSCIGVTSTMVSIWTPKQRLETNLGVIGNCWYLALLAAMDLKRVLLFFEIVVGYGANLITCTVFHRILSWKVFTIAD